MRGGIYKSKKREEANTFYGIALEKKTQNHLN